MDPARLAALDETGATVAIVLVTVAIGLGVTFIVWLHRAHSNLRAARVDRLKYGSGWAIGGWFVPLLNFWRPYQVTAEVWKASAFLAGRAHVTSWQRAPAGGIVKAWWLAGLVAGGAAQGAIRLRLTAFTVDRRITAEWADVVSSVASVLTAVLAIELVRRVTDMQERARSRLAHARREHAAE